MSPFGIAWLQCDGIQFWSRSRHPLDSLEFKPEVDSSVIQLISGIYQRDPRWARRIIRHRISTTEPLEESLAGTVKVAARRVQFSMAEVPDFKKSDVEILGRGHTADRVLESWVAERMKLRAFVSDSEIWDFLDAMIAAAMGVSPKVVALPVSAVLLDHDGRVLSWGMNSAWDFRTEHAETNLIRRWYSQGAPGVPAALWVTRKSCKMCAGWIYDAFVRVPGRKQLSIHFRDPDDGPMARLTVLDRGSFESVRAMSRARGLIHAPG